MAKITINNIDYEVPPEAANAFSEEKSKADRLQKNFDSGKSELETTTGKLDAVSLENKTLQESNNGDEVNKAGNAQLELLAEASKHVDTKDLVGLAPIEIKKKVILSKFPESKLDKKSDEYIEGQYEIALQSQVQASNADEKVRNSGFANNQNIKVDKKSYIDHTNRVGDSQAAHAAPVDRLLKAWETPVNA